MSAADAPADTSASAPAPALNALQANVAARGANAYYYAHGNSSGGQPPKPPGVL